MLALNYRRPYRVRVDNRPDPAIEHPNDAGSSVQNLRVGQPVLVPFNVFCGSCYFCQRELYGNCHDTNPQATAVGGIYGA
jgi:hypothetical protein